MTIAGRRDAALGLALDAMRRGASLDQAVTTALVALKAAGDEDEPWAEDAQRLGLIEALARAGLLTQWRSLRDRVLRLLGLLLPAGDRYDFDPTDLPALVAAGELMAQAVTQQGGALAAAQEAAWRRGMLTAAIQISAPEDLVAQAIARSLARMRAHYAAHGLSLVRGGLGRVFQRPIVAALAAGEFDGLNPVNVARELRRRFGAGDYNWERLARSETAWAHGAGKLQLMQEQGIERFDYVTAGDDRVSRICRDLEAASPYLVADPAAPIPVRDSHPNCRCTLLPVLPD